MSLVEFFLLFVIATCGFAFWRGGFDERFVAVVFLLGLGLTFWTQSALAERWHHVELGIFAVDLGMYAAFLWLAARSERFWPIWMSAFQGVQLLSHALGLPGSPHLNLIYSIFAQLWGYPMLILLVVGVVRRPNALRMISQDGELTRLTAVSVRLAPPR